MQALRAGFRSRLHAVTVLVSFAIGVAANAVAAAVVSSFWLRPLPYPDSDRLIVLRGGSAAESGADGRAVSSSLLDVWRHDAGSIEQIAAYSVGTLTLLTPEGAQASIPVAWVTPEFLPLLGTAAARGRLLGLDDSGAAVATGEFAADRFGLPRMPIGHPVRLNGATYEIVGMLGRDFRFPGVVQPALILSLPRPRGSVVRYVQALARLRSGERLERAERELTSLRAHWRSDRPGEPGARRGPLAASLVSELAGPLPALVALGASGAALVLALACGNVLVATVAFVTERAPDIFTRLALGATPRQAIQPLILAQVGLLACGVAVALLVTHWLLAAAGPMLVGVVSIPERLTVDHWTLAAVLGLGTAAAAVTLSVPLVAASRHAAASSRRSQMFRRGRAETAIQDGLVVAQAACAFVALVVTLLLARTVAHYRGPSLGFDDRDVVTVRLSDSFGTTPPNEKVAWLNEVTQRIRAQPPVVSAAAVTALPFAPAGFTFRVFVEGEPPPPQSAMTPVELVTPGYFSALRIPIVKGRDFTDGDTEHAPPVAIVNEAFVRMRLEPEFLLGTKIGLGGPDEVAIVGVVGDFRSATPYADSHPQVFRPFAQAYPQMGWYAATVVARVTHGNEGAVTQVAMHSARASSRRISAYDASALSDKIAFATRREAQAATVAAVLSGTVLVLGLSGVACVTALRVARDRRESGVRAALGAGRLQIVGLFVYRAMRVASCGVLCGIPIAIGIVGLLQHQYAILLSPSLGSYAWPAVLVVGLATLASALASWKSGRPDVIEALRPGSVGPL